jgi:multidrug efflux pump
MQISDVSIRRPVFASMLSLALVLFGAIGYRQLSIRELPDVDPPIISVRTSLRGANPQVMESSVTDVLEEELSTVPGLRTLTSSSGEQSSNITLEFTLDVDIESAAQEVRDKVSRVRGRLPQDVDEPVIAKEDADAQPFIRIAMTSDVLDQLQLSDLADREVKQRLQAISGVGSIQINGERRYAMRVWLDARQLSARGLTTTDVANAIRTRSIEVPAGRIESDRREFSVRSLGELKSPAEFADLVVSNTNGQLVRLGDVARVALGAEDERSLIRINGVDGVGLGIVRQSKANLVDVADAVRAATPAIAAALPPGVNLQVTLDQSIFVKRSIKDAQETLVIAAILVVVIIFIFLRNLRATLIPAFAIPASIIATFAVMRFAGFSINSFTLLALTLAIGIVVDDAIIVLENAYRHQEELGEDPETAAREGTREIGFAVLATTASLIAVFTPLAFLQGNTGRLFNEFGIAVAGAIAISGFVALTLTPMLCAKILRVPQSHGVMYRALERGFDALSNAYAWSLALALRFRFLVLGGTVALTMLSGLVFLNLKREFIPADDRGYFFTNIVGPEGASIGYMKGYVEQADKILSAVPETEVTAAGVGRGGGPVNNGYVFVILKSWEERKRSVEEILNDVRPKLAQIPGVLAFASAPAAQRGFGSPVQFVVRHPDFEQLSIGMDSLQARAQGIKGLVNVDTDLRVNKPELTIAFDRDRAEDLGVAVSDVAGTLQTMLGGSRVSSFTRNNKLYYVITQLAPESRATPSDMSGLFVRGRDGKLVQLDAMTTVSEGVGPRSLTHFNRVRSATLSASLAPGFALGEALDSLTRIATDVLPAGSSVALSGESREFSESGSELLFAFGLALLVVFMVLAVQFESIVHPFTVLLAVPLAVTGALFTLAAVGSTINLYSQIGMILLIGIVCKNSILLVENANQQRALGKDAFAAMLEAGRIRLRPILMTSVATIMGAVPVALGLGAGAESRRPLGYAIVGGVFFSTLLTLYVVPSVYTLLDRLTSHAPAPKTVPVPALASVEVE